MAKETLETTFEKYKYDSNISKKSKVWFQQQTLLLARKRIEPRRLFSEERTTSKITPGKLYMFYYDAKHKDTLPYYDAFPLVFPYQKTPGGFMGLNMHYLPYFFRVQLMTRLMEFSTNKSLDETTRIRYSWGLIANASKFRLAHACIKHYLTDHVQSLFVEVEGSDWHTAMMLPVERFVGSTKNTVWGDSLKV